MLYFPRAFLDDDRTWSSVSILQRVMALLKNSGWDLIVARESIAWKDEGKMKNDGSDGRILSSYARSDFRL